MECRGIEEKLSAYIDKQLSSEEKVLVEGHLRDCSKCSLVLKELKQTILHTQRIEEVDPPAWLEQKIMANVREDAGGKNRLYQKLLYPLRIKIPIHAAATLAICVVGFFVYKNLEPELKHILPPETKQVITQQESDEMVPEVGEHIKKAEIPIGSEPERHPSPTQTLKKSTEGSHEITGMDSSYEKRMPSPGDNQITGSSQSARKEFNYGAREHESFLAEIIAFQDPGKAYMSYEVLFKGLKTGELFCDEYRQDHPLFQLIFRAHNKFKSEYPEFTTHDIRQQTRVLNLPKLEIIAGEPHRSGCSIYEFSRSVSRWRIVEQ